MISYTQGSQFINGVPLAMQSYIEQRTLSALLQSTQSPSTKSDDLTFYRQDAAIDSGVPVGNIVP